VEKTITRIWKRERTTAKKISERTQRPQGRGGTPVPIQSFRLKEKGREGVTRKKISSSGTESPMKKDQNATSGDANKQGRSALRESEKWENYDSNCKNTGAKANCGRKQKVKRYKNSS